MTPILAAGFNQVSTSYGVTIPQVALTTGLYMMGLGIGSVIASPTAILFGKRPVYLVASIIFLLSAVWCALSPNYPSLVIARIVMGLAVSPVECLPSATIAEIFFLHERAYRLGIYTLLLLGGKNLIPLVGAAIVEGLGWRWIFWIVAIVVGFGGCLLFLFVPETFWDRTPRPHKPSNKPHRPRFPSHLSMPSIFRHGHGHVPATPKQGESEWHGNEKAALGSPGFASPVSPTRRSERHAHFGDPSEDISSPMSLRNVVHGAIDGTENSATETDMVSPRARFAEPPSTHESPNAAEAERGDSYFTMKDRHQSLHDDHTRDFPTVSRAPTDLSEDLANGNTKATNHYTAYYRSAPPKSYVQTLKVYSGRLSPDSWYRVAFRPFILFCYPSILWSATVYALSVGWLIVLSESVASIYQNRATYHFTPLQTGLVYLSPFIGGVLGTAVAGKVSDLIVRWMSRRNGGIYEPEFRLVMAIPVALTTTIGLMGYGWSAAERDAWIVPTLFFGIISFGCCVGSTTAITFAVDSYRQYAGEALVTLNFSKSE